MGVCEDELLKVEVGADALTVIGALRGEELADSGCIRFANDVGGATPFEGLKLGEACLRLGEFIRGGLLGGLIDSAGAGCGCERGLRGGNVVATGEV